MGSQGRSDDSRPLINTPQVFFIVFQFAGPHRIYVPFAAWGDEEASHLAIDHAMKQLIHTNNAPMVLPPLIPADIYQETMQLFLLGLMSPEEAAQHIYNRLWIWMHE